MKVSFVVVCLFSSISHISVIEGLCHVTMLNTTMVQPAIILSLILMLGTWEGEDCFAPKEGSWEPRRGPWIVAWIINQCSGDLARFLLERIWLVNISDTSVLEPQVRVTIPPDDMVNEGSRITTAWELDPETNDRHVSGMRKKSRGITPNAGIWNLSPPLPPSHWLPRWYLKQRFQGEDSRPQCRLWRKSLLT